MFEAKRNDGESTAVDFTSVVDSLGTGVLVISANGELQAANASARRIFELDIRSDGSPGNANDHFPLVDADGRELAPEDHPDKIVARTGRAVAGMVVGFDRTDGQRVWVTCNVGLVNPADPANSAIAASFTDVTAQHVGRAMLQYAADHDMMTELPNRACVMRRLNDVVANSQRCEPAESTVVMFIDLDSLKQVNDSLGHGGGDVALVTAANRLRGILNEYGIVGRFGGDEFVAVLSGISGADRIAVLSKRVHDSLVEPVIIQGRLLRIRASVGIVEVTPSDMRSAEEVIRAADTAMYQAKSAGGGHSVVFDTNPVPRRLTGAR